LAKHVVILTHRRTPLGGKQYFLGAIADVWREEGLRVSVVDEPAVRIDADAAILHTDLTVAPQQHLAFVRSYAVAINGAVSDISKRRTSAHLVRRGDGWTGPVIVKTDRNCGGAAEDRVAARGSHVARAVRTVRNALPWGFRARIPTSEYRILGSVREVPWVVWRNPDLVVERYLPERRGAHHCLRTWVFFGDRETNSICWSDQAVVKADNVLGREPVADVPPDLRTIRRELGFDFGKFDYAIVEGRTILYDANRTPTVGAFPREQVLQRIRVLAAGIRAFL
jgi:hypothetical protein